MLLRESGGHTQPWDTLSLDLRGGGNVHYLGGERREQGEGNATHIFASSSLLAVELSEKTLHVNREETLVDPSSLLPMLPEKLGE